MHAIMLLLCMSYPKFFALFLHLSAQSLLVLHFGRDGRHLFLLPLDVLVDLVLVPLQVGQGLLGAAEVALKFALGLLHIRAGLKMRKDIRKKRKKKNVIILQLTKNARFLLLTLK